MPPILDIKNLSKIYRRTIVANHDISLQVWPGEVFGLLGHNGAGKTTLLNQIIGLTKPTGGEIYIDGHDVVSQPNLGRKLCSVQPQSHIPLDSFTPMEAIEVMARIRGLSQKKARHHAERIIYDLDITDWAYTKGRHLSGGLKRIMAFAMTACVPGRLVMFDEPTNDVDPIRRRILWAQSRKLADSGSAVLLVTHNIVEAEGVVDRIAIMHAGKIVDAGTPTELRNRHANLSRLEIIASNGIPHSDFISRFEASKILNISANRLAITVTNDEYTSSANWINDLRNRGDIDNVSLTAAGLEDIYIWLTMNESNSPDVQPKPREEPPSNSNKSTLRTRPNAISHDTNLPKNSTTSGDIK